MLVVSIPCGLKSLEILKTIIFEVLELFYIAFYFISQPPQSVKSSDSSLGKVVMYPIYVF